MKLKCLNLLFVILLFNACENDVPEAIPGPIEYPEMGTYGLNLLHGTDTLFLPGNGNSFRAIIPEGRSLKIEMEQLIGVKWGINVASNTGWSVSNYSDGFQSFEALNGGTTELEIIKWPGLMEGAILIKYFEDSDTLTRQKVLIWQD